MNYDKDAPRAKKSLGQNFLQDKNIARKIVDLLQAGPQDNVLEIGPGPGMLTGFLQECGPAKLVLVEKDNHWARVRQDDERNGIRPQVILADALTIPWERFEGSWKIIGNLPYNVASPLMWDILSMVPGLVRAVFMVQKEVGQRLAAEQGSSAYGALSVWVQSFSRPRMEFIVPPQVFRPAPKVHSAVLSFEPLPPDARPANPDGLSKLLKICFQQRRKQLGTIFRAAGLDANGLEQAGISAELRPERLSSAQFQKLASCVFN
ncbi:16S rRNA (adenine(1518)-N(6)/adenine(1519)-N(6))-dimethyltransferase RsmA [Desulfovibrio sp. OttesenSCG-928-C06]|nr:16S rRNA (adenine(1518)-N(6)/adenine(1519)-N(6))-dimethyltransferase RsmA [Desulfovibrio sp. OttesenSCG-928-C06]